MWQRSAEDQDTHDLQLFVLSASNQTPDTELQKSDQDLFFSSSFFLFFWVRRISRYQSTGSNSRSGCAFSVLLFFRRSSTLSPIQGRVSRVSILSHEERLSMLGGMLQTRIDFRTCNDKTACSDVLLYTICFRITPPGR